MADDVSWDKRINALVLDWANGRLTINQALEQAYALGMNEGAPSE